MPNIRFRVVAAIVVLMALIGSCPGARAELYELDLHLHSSELPDNGYPAEIGASDALLPVKAAAKQARPAGSQFDFIGVASGESFWRLPKSQNGSLLYLSIGTEELTPADFASTITLSLVSVTGTGGGAAPGVFSVWDIDDFGGVVPLMSTLTGAGTPNSLAVAAGGHYHRNYGFTAPGLYNVEFTATATLAAALGGGQVTGSAIYSFGVFDVGSDYSYPSGAMPWTYQGQQFSIPLIGNEHIDMGIALAAVPEPSSVVLAGMGAAGLAGAALRSRMRRRQSAAPRV
jgi:surface-anchored protein